MIWISVGLASVCVLSGFPPGALVCIVIGALLVWQFSRPGNWPRFFTLRFAFGCFGSRLRQLDALRNQFYRLRNATPLMRGSVLLLASKPTGMMVVDGLIREFNGHVAFRERRPGVLQVLAPSGRRPQPGHKPSGRT